jgi:small subunit ribosomal protein S9
MSNNFYNGVGRRKSSVARVYLSDGKGTYTVNKNSNIKEYLKRDSLVIHALEPLTVLNLNDKIDLKINVSGGGLTGQAGAIRLGIARALIELNEDFKLQLRNRGLLTRDSRVVERKKYGQPGARKKFQFSKR